MSNSNLPVDYEVCGTCGFDHAYEPSEAQAAHIALFEKDEDYRNRIAKKLPAGSWYEAEDLGNASGYELDCFGERYNLPRKTLA